MRQAVNIFFMGKGGVGKSTSSALNAVFLAETGARVLLVSLDPAHNQSDIFDRKLTERPVELSPRLFALEVDQDRWMRGYLKEVHQQIRQSYRYLTALNLDRYFKVIRYAPGLEEHALIQAFQEIRRRFETFDFIIFDMPPTALSLRFFNLPTLSLLWIEQLLALRRRIIEKREIITKITVGQKQIERDKILNRILELRESYQSLKALFEDPQLTRIHLVLNPDRLSFAESLRIYESLKETQIGLHRVVYNKMQADSSCAEVDAAFAGIPMLSFPQSDTPLIGYPQLQKYLKAHAATIEQQLHVCFSPDLEGEG